MKKYIEIYNDDVWLKCICTNCQKKMLGKKTEEGTIYVKDMEENDI